MLLCAEKEGRVELIQASESCQPGDRVRFEDGSVYDPSRQAAILNPKKKIFEACAAHLKTDSNGLPMYKNFGMVVVNDAGSHASGVKEILPTNILNGIIR